MARFRASRRAALVISPALSWLLFVVVTGASLAAAGHALLFKRDPRAALGWVSVCLLFPVVGSLLYYVFGINRIRTRARRLLADVPTEIKHRSGPGAPPMLASPEALARILQPEARPRTALDSLVRVSTLVTQLSISRGNRVRPLVNGENAFPAMLEAIAGAQQTIYLSTYIFETNETGKRFVEALAEAVQRGVEVRVLVDGIGELYSLPGVSRLLRRRGIPVARFLPPRLLPPQVNINLRNHRKMLIVDGRTAFTGGMNIGDRHLAERRDPKRVVDLHFQVDGPVVRHLEDVFLDDWEFITGESIEPHAVPAPMGETWARPIVDGPAEELDQLLNILMSAISVARRRVWIMTPYFLPPREIISAMQAATLRGVDLRLVLPGKNNLPYVHWASRNVLSELLHWGARIWYQPPPFVHTKLLIVDDDYSQIGCANLDARSLRLNFEISLELYDPALVAVFEEHFETAFEASRELTMHELEERPLWIRLRDAAAWLFSPYL